MLLSVLAVYHSACSTEMFTMILYGAETLKYIAQDPHQSIKH